MKFVFATLSKCFHALVHRHALHAPEHVGQFAGSLLPLEDWQHN